MNDIVERRLDSKAILLAVETMTSQNKETTREVNNSLAVLSKDINKLCVLQQVSEEKNRTFEKRLSGMYRRVDKHTDVIGTLTTWQAGCQKKVFAKALQLLKEDMTGTIGDINIAVEKKIAGIRLENAEALKELRGSVRKDLVVHVSILWTALLSAAGVITTVSVKMFGKG